MGNCCRRESSTAVWAGDDWGSMSAASSKHRRHQKLFDGVKENAFNMERQRLLEVENGSGSSTREVKIKITKRELEELMARVDMQQGLTMEQVLAGLINSSDNKFELDHHRPWKPALQSIPEIN